MSGPQRRTSANEAIIARLTEGSALLSELQEATGLSYGGVKSTISRLRTKGFRIFSESTSVSGDPRYTLSSGPGSLGPSFVCQACAYTIRLGHVSDHREGCQFGTTALKGLTS